MIAKNRSRDTIPCKRRKGQTDCRQGGMYAEYSVLDKQITSAMQCSALVIKIHRSIVIIRTPAQFLLLYRSRRIYGIARDCS